MFRPDSEVRITADTYASATLDEWQSAFWNLYGSVDQHIPLYDMMLQLVGDSARLAEAIRKRNYIEAFPVIPRMLSWLTTMVTKVAVNNARYHDLGRGRSLAEIVWNKYPTICYQCLHSRCTCILRDIDAEKDQLARLTEDEYTERQAAIKQEREVAIEQAQRENTRPAKLDDWVKMFDTIYSGVNRTRTSAEKTFHLLEEIGEVERELRSADRIRARVAPPRALEWEDEIADVFSWLMAVFLHVRRRMDRSDAFAIEYRRITHPGAEHSVDAPDLPTFPSLLWAEFGDPQVGIRCHRCRKTRCDMTTSTSLEASDNRQDSAGPVVIPERR